MECSPSYPMWQMSSDFSNKSLAGVFRILDARRLSQFTQLIQKLFFGDLSSFSLVVPVLVTCTAPPPPLYLCVCFFPVTRYLQIWLKCRIRGWFEIVLHFESIFSYLLLLEELTPVFNCIAINSVISFRFNGGSWVKVYNHFGRVKRSLMNLIVNRILRLARFISGLKICGMDTLMQVTLKVLTPCGGHFPSNGQ